MIIPHPIIVHFPIALLIVAGLFAIVHLITKKEVFREVCFWNLILGTLGAIAAVISGIDQSNTIVHNNAIHEVMILHQNLAYTVLAIFVLLTIWTIVRKAKMSKAERVFHVLAFLIGIGFITYTGHLGGQMVFKHGAAVKPMEKIINTGHDHGSHSHGDKKK